MSDKSKNQKIQKQISKESDDERDKCFASFAPRIPRKEEYSKESSSSDSKSKTKLSLTSSSSNKYSKLASK